MQARTRGDEYAGPIEVGRRVHCILYGGNDGIVIAVHGTPNPGSIRRLGGFISMGGGAEYDIAFDNHISRRLPECILRGVQWFIYDDIASPEQSEAMIKSAENAQEEARRQREEEARAHAAEVAALPARYPHLKPIVGRYPTPAEGAANLRIELKRAFPGVKFSVRSSRYSGGDSIDVYWTDGPTSEQVKAISDKYQECDFDGMQDLEIARKAAFPEVFGGASYVMEQRSESPAFIVSVAAKLGYNLKEDDFDRGAIKGINWETQQMIYREAWQIAAI